MGRPANSKNGGPNGTSTGKHSSCRTTKTTKISVSKTQSSSSGSGSSERKNMTGKADRSQQNFPYDIRLGGFASLLNAVTKGSPKIKRILMDEADYIMECRVCRNLFRSLPNFITHKQTYCKKVFDSTWSIGLSSLIQNSDTAYNIEYEVDPELLVVDNDKFNTSAAPPESSLTSHRQATNSRSPYEFYDELSTRLQMSKHPSPLENGTSNTDSNAGQSSKHEIIRLGIKPLVERPCGTIVLQHRILSDPSNCDNISAHMYPAESAKKDTAVLGPDGKVIYTGSSKGIDAVVSKLTAKLNTMENSGSLDAFSMTISCETCKTVFDSDKALRQHKRESLDCGQTWSFKSPGGGGESAKTKDSPENPAIPSKRLKFTENALSKCFAYAKPKRSTQNRMLRSPKKSLSPVKKIKKKYSKLDSSCIHENLDQTLTQSQDTSLCCNRCSRSFGTKHEMSLHLALCNGVINYALLRNSEPVEEKIRISVRNNHDVFTTSSVSSNSLSETIDKDDSESVSSNESQVTPSHSPASQVQMSTSKDLGSLSCGDNAEVNNNKQYKNGYCSQPGNENQPKTKDEDGVPPPTIVLDPKSNTGDDETECDKRGSDTVSTDSGVSSDSAGPMVKRQDVSKAPNSRKQKSPKSRGKPPDVLVLDQVTNRLEKGIEIRRTRPSLPGKAMKPNLRKTVAARLRKSRRMLRVRASKV